MKKRVAYLLMFMAMLILSGCNLFKGLDKEDLSAPGAFEFKLDDAMASGDYTVVVGLIDSKIASDYATIDSEIKSIQTSLAALTTYLNANISNASVKEYIDLKVIQAEAYAGAAG